MMKPGSTKMMEESVPAVEATVWTMLFSWAVGVNRKNPSSQRSQPGSLALCSQGPAWPSARSSAMDSTTAGMEVEKVRPALRPKYTFAAVNTTHSTMPMRMPRMVISFTDMVLVWFMSVRPLRRQAALACNITHPIPGVSVHKPMTGEARQRLQLVLAFAVVYIVWGSTYLAIRIGVADLPPALLA